MFEPHINQPSHKGNNNMISNQSIEPLLLASLNATQSELANSPALSSGYIKAQNKWEVIIKYVGNSETVFSQFSASDYKILLGGYAILTLSKEEIADFSLHPEIIYIEKPKNFYYEVYNGKIASCINTFSNRYNLSGQGTLVGIVDSGIDFTHPDFINPDGSTRIAYLWDQTTDAVYSSSDINVMLSSGSSMIQNMIYSLDPSGHGTHVAGIAAGNGSASQGVYRGVAYEATLLVVKLAPRSPLGFPQTTQIMEGVDFCIKKSIELGMPISINLSLGNTYGSHSGTSLLESFLNDVSGVYKTSIIVGSGNEGSSDGHIDGLLNTLDEIVELSVGEFTPNLTVQLWKQYWDKVAITIEAPSGTSVALDLSSGEQRYQIDNTSLYVTTSPPSPFSIFGETYIDMLPLNNYVGSGIWKIILTPIRIKDGRYALWLPGGTTRNTSTKFLTPSPLTTLTIPSTAYKIITVGAYNSYSDTLPAFSGRGFTWSTNLIKPDLVAPGVDITSCAPGGGYTSRTGTSMATPFVTGSCSLLMEWGIVKNNDPYMYGEKIKAALIQGTRKLPSVSTIPSPEAGWGALCLDFLLQ